MNDNAVWIESEGTYYLTSLRNEHDKLDNAVYVLNQDEFGRFYLKKTEENFTFNYKLYGIESKLIARSKKTFDNTKGNLGILLNGLKGTGKTVTAKLMCNELSMPTIIINNHYENGHIFLNEIPQDINIFVDEYEKIFKEKSNHMLTIMDGALNSEHRRVFILTTNELFVNENLLQRPGRIRYLKTFRDLSIKIIDELLEDILINKAHKADTMAYISTLEVITIDIVKAICQEINIHDESPAAFADVFNVKVLTGKQDIYIIHENETIQIAKNKKVYPRKDFDPEYTVGQGFSINDDHIGEVIEVIDPDTIKVRCDLEPGDDYYEQLKANFGISATTSKMPELGVLHARPYPTSETVSNKPEGFSGLLTHESEFTGETKTLVEFPSTSPKQSRKKQKDERIVKEFIFRIQAARMVHSNYRWEHTSYAY